MTNTQVSPFVKRVLTQPLNWTVHAMALLERSRLEFERAKTIPRAVMQLESLLLQQDECTASTGTDALPLCVFSTLRVIVLTACVCVFTSAVCTTVLFDFDVRKRHGTFRRTGWCEFSRSPHPQTRGWPPLHGHEHSDKVSIVV
jgi:hypothetical protein